MTRTSLAVGLMSGTSADGVDAACVRVARASELAEVEVLAASSFAYPDALRRRVLGARDSGVADLARLDVELGERFAVAARDVIAASGLGPGDVDVIGSHGQTVVHLPGEGAPGPSGRRGAVTLQVGRAAVIAERVGVPVIADFRSRDAAAGGEAAPLVPYVDWLLLRPATGTRLVVNLGGVANVTLVTRDLADVRAFDTGPANGPLDAAASLLLLAGTSRDEGGAAAARGSVHSDVVERLLADPWFRRPPPRSADRDRWGAAFVAELAAQRPELCADDVLATLTETVARSVAEACREHLPAGDVARVRDVVVSGGGVHNATLMRRLATHLAPLNVVSSAEHGFDPDHREAVAFAVLAVEAVAGRAANVPAVTGAAGPRVLGALYPA